MSTSHRPYFRIVQASIVNAIRFRYRAVPSRMVAYAALLIASDGVACAQSNVISVINANTTDIIANNPTVFFHDQDSDFDQSAGERATRVDSNISTSLQTHRMKVTTEVSKNLEPDKPITLRASHEHEFELLGESEDYLWYTAESILESSATFSDTVEFVSLNPSLPNLATVEYVIGIEGSRTQIIDIPSDQRPRYRLEDLYELRAHANGFEKNEIFSWEKWYEPHAQEPVTTEYSDLDGDVNIFKEKLFPPNGVILGLEVNLQRVIEFGNIVGYAASVFADLKVTTTHRFLNDGQELNYFLRGNADFLFDQSADFLGVIVRDETGAIRTDVDVTSAQGVIYPVLSEPIVLPPEPDNAVILSPVAVVESGMGTFSGDTSLESMINGSGFAAPFISGETAFDEFVDVDNSQPSTDSLYTNNWQSQASFDGQIAGILDFDFGDVHPMDRLAIWNGTLKDVTVSVATSADGPWQQVGEQTLRNNTPTLFALFQPDVIEFDDVYDARYVRVEVASVYPFLLNDTLAYAIVGEVAASVVPGRTLLGDFNQNGVLDANDVDLLAREIREAGAEEVYDVNDDGFINAADLDFWVHDLANTYFGDADLDGEFGSGDLVQIFQIGEYEDGIQGNSGWDEGDWNGDGDFSSGDLVVAFQDGGYGVGTRQSVLAVPEPSGLQLFTTLVALGIPNVRRRFRCTADLTRVTICCALPN